MVNYKRVICEVVVVLGIISLAIAAPTPDCNEKHYDQRQNGTENYRLNIDGVVIAIAPAESLLAAASDLDISDFLDIEDFTDFQKPKPPAESPAKPEDKPGDVITKPDEAKPDAAKPDAKPDAAKPGQSSEAASSLTPNLRGKKKDASIRKQEKAQRLKQRLANVLLPLLRKTRHH